MAVAPNIIVYDIETGGFLTKEHKYGLAELAAIAINSETGEELGRYEQIIAPYKTFDGTMVQYTPEALRVNGLTLPKIESGLDSMKAVKEFSYFVGQYKIKSRSNGNPIFAGHNIIEFDNPYMSQLFDLHKQEFSKIINPSVFDTLWLTRLIYQGKLLDNKLGTACSVVGIELIDAHRALADVEANVDLVRNYLQRLQGNGVTAEDLTETKRYRKSFQL